MRNLKITQAGILTLHLWQRPLPGAENRAVTSSVRVLAADGTHRLDGGATDDFQIHVAELSGPATIEWDDSDTEISLAYVFNREKVAREGITVLLTTERNAATNDRFVCHLRPPFGWMNDPNGMSMQEDRLHVFYQHYPHARRWSAMHWGHAATDNLVDWVHYPIFLNPAKELLADRTKLGGVFSGSAVAMSDGSLRAFYTDRDDNRLPNWEWQKTALSRDWITAEPARTIIQDRPPEPDTVRDNRDAYVFKGDDGRWKLLLGGADKAGGIIYLYETAAEDAASDWQYVGIFHRETIGGSLPLECPCLVPLDGAGEGLHLLIFGIIGMRDKTTLRRHLSFGVVGRLEGDRLVDTRRFEMDFGTDAYAFQAIQRTEGPLAIAWAANWAEVFKEMDFPSAMTFPRRISFDGVSLRTPPAAAVNGLRTELLSKGPLSTFTTLELPNGLGDIRLDKIDGDEFEIEFVHPEFGLSLTYDGAEMELHFNAGNRITPRYLRRTGQINDVRILIDRGLLEIFVDGGAHCCTKRFDSAVPIRIVRMTSRGKHRGATFEVHELRPAKTFIHYQENTGLAGS